MENKIKRIVESKSLEELNSFVDSFVILKNFYDTQRSMNSKEIKDMFNLYTHYTDIEEYGYFCGSCRAKVYKTLSRVHNVVQDELNGRINGR